MLTSEKHSIESYFKNPKHQLANLVDKINQLRVFNQALIGILEDKLMRHCQVVNVEQGTLTLITDSASWATKLRFQTPEILKKMQTSSTFLKIKKLKVLIRPKERLITKKQPKKKTLHLSRESAQIISDAANHLKNIRLKKALNKIAEHANHDRP